MKKRYYITGIPGTGKTTIGQELSKHGMHFIDQDSKEYGLCSWKNNHTKEDAFFEYGIGKEFLESNDWYCDIEKLKQLLDTYSGTIFVCGVSANQDEYLNLFDKVFLLQCSPETFLKRINAREKKFGKHESEKEHLIAWHQDLEHGLIKRGAVVINSENPIEIVTEEILRIVKEK